MEENIIKTWLSHSITGIATIASWKGLFKTNPIIQENCQGIYGLCKQYPKELGTVYAVFRYNDELEELLDRKLTKESFFIDKVIVGDSLVYKLDKDYWMTKKEWKKVTKSDYSKIFKEAKDDDLLRHIKDNTEELRSLMSNYLNCDIPEGQIYWKRFDIEDETLDLDIIKDLTVMQYKKQELIAQMKKDSYNESAYQWVLDNSIEIIEVEDQLIDTDFGAMFDRLQEYLEEIEGTKQYQLVIQGKKYPLMPNKIDFIGKMKSLVKKYKPKDMKKIERCLKKHLENKSMQLKYYIMKNNESSLMTDYDNEEEKKVRQTTFDV